MKKFINKRKRSFCIFSLFISFLIIITPTVNALELTITENGTGSTNTEIVNISSDTSVQQSNNANVSSNIETNSNTGGNSVSGSSGEALVSTGNINNQVSVENSGNVSTIDNICCQENTATLDIASNGTESTNSTIINQNNSKDVNVVQNANIENVVNGSANTGENSVKSNLGDVEIQTGNIDIQSEIVNGPINISDVNISAGGNNLYIKVDDNASNSQNLIDISSDKKIGIFISNTSKLDNLVNWDLNTGNNFVDGNNGDVFIETGNISFGLFIKNLANLSDPKVNCCGVPDNHEEDNQEQGDGGNSSSGGQSSSSGGSSSSSGSILPSAASTEAGGPGIVGLSDTSSEAAQTLFFWLSLIMIVFGGKIISEEVLPGSSNKK